MADQEEPEQDQETKDRVEKQEKLENDYENLMKRNTFGQIHLLKKDKAPF